MNTFDYIVVGAGIEGSATAYTLAKNGYRTLLLEQFPVLHTRGSSHGASRITRKGYNEKTYAQMMIEGYRLWNDLEKKSGTKLFLRTGCLTIAAKKTGIAKNQKKILDSLSVPNEYLSAEDMEKRWPFFKYDSTYDADFDKDGGILKADKCLRAFQDEFKKLGGELRDEEGVENVLPGERVTVITAKEEYSAKGVVLCLGSWAGIFAKRLGLNIPLEPQKVTVWYWKMLNPALSSENGFPTFIVEDIQHNLHHCYGLPASEYPGMLKLCLHRGPNVTPESRDKATPERELEILTKYLKEHFVGIENKPSINEQCIYTWTPDGNFILDSHPKWKNIVFGCGFSGHGFKLAPIVGKVLSELVTQTSASYNLDMFKLSRFGKNIFNNSML